MIELKFNPQTQTLLPILLFYLTLSISARNPKSKLMSNMDLLNETEELLLKTLDITGSMKNDSKEQTAKNRLFVVSNLKAIERNLLLVYNNAIRFKEPTIEQVLNNMSKDIKNVSYLINTARPIQKKYSDVLQAKGVEISNSVICGILNCLEKGYYNSTHWLTYCLGNSIYDFIEKARFIMNSRVIPSERRELVKKKLDDLGQSKINEIFELIDENLIAKHYKDCIDNCRKALMRVSEAIVLKLGREAQTSYEGNLNIMTKMNMIDSIEKRDFSTFFSILSQKSQHEELDETNKLTPEDCSYLIDATYIKLKRMLDKFWESRKS